MRTEVRLEGVDMKEYGVKQCLIKWGVDMKGVIAGGNDKRTVSIVQEQSTRNR